MVKNHSVIISHNKHSPYLKFLFIPAPSLKRKNRWMIIMRAICATASLANPERQMQKSLLIEQAFRIWSVPEDYTSLRDAPCGPLLKQRSLAALESNLCPRRFSSSEHQMQKSLLVEQAFRIWSVIEDYTSLRDAPCGPLLKQRSLAALESNLCSRRFSSSERQMQKSLLVEQAFRIWSVIEDSNLRPLRPERSALPGCANHRMRGAYYCRATPASIPY